MVTQVIKSVGNSGRDYTSFAAFFAAAPADLVAADQEWIAEVYIGEINITATQSTGAHTTDATRHFTIRPATGNGIKDNVAASDPLYYNPAKGAAINFGVSFAACIDVSGAPYTAITGLQIKSTASATTEIIVCAINCSVVANLFDVAFGSAVVNAGNGNTTVRNNLMIVRSGVGAISFGYSGGSKAEFNTIYAPNGANLDSGGNPMAAIGSQQSDVIVKNNAIFGFTRAFNNDTYFSAGSFNNATDLATLVGTSNLTSLVFASQFNTTTDLHIKVGSAMIGAGVTISGVTTDILGQTRASPPSIGSVMYTAPAATPVSFSGPVPTRNGVVGSAASFANASFFAGSLTPFVYTLQAGVLPAGLTLSSSTGAITGTPTTAGTSSGIVIRATDTNSNTADTNAYSIVIAATNASPTFPGVISNITGTGGSAITPVNVSGQFSDTDALAYSASPAGTAWPSGLIVNSSTGIISGTVATSTTTGLKVRATDTASQTVDSNAFSATLAAPTSSITWAPQGSLKSIMGAPAASVAVHAFINDKTTGALIATKTGLTTNSTGGVAPFTTTAGTAGVSAEVKIVDDTNPLRRSIEIVTPT